MYVRYRKYKSNQLYIIKKDTPYQMSAITFDMDSEQEDPYKDWDESSFALGSVIPDIIDTLQEEERKIILYATARMESDGLFVILPYICDTEIEGAFHLFDCKCPSGSGYGFGQISYEFNKEMLRKMLEDEMMPFQWEAGFAGVVVKEEYAEEAIDGNYFHKHFHDRLVEIGETFFETDRDFEFFKILSRIKSNDEILKNVKDILSGKYRFEEKIK